MKAAAVLWWCMSAMAAVATIVDPLDCHRGKVEFKIMTIDGHQVSVLTGGPDCPADLPLMSAEMLQEASSVLEGPDAGHQQALRSAPASRTRKATPGFLPVLLIIGILMLFVGMMAAAIVVRHKQNSVRDIRTKGSEEFAVGDRVMVREADNDEWKAGTVTSVAPLKVKPDEFFGSFSWSQIHKQAMEVVKHVTDSIASEAGEYLEAEPAEGAQEQSERNSRHTESDATQKRPSRLTYDDNTRAYRLGVADAEGRQLPEQSDQGAARAEAHGGSGRKKGCLPCGPCAAKGGISEPEQRGAF